MNKIDVENKLEEILRCDISENENCSATQFAEQYGDFPPTLDSIIDWAKAQDECTALFVDVDELKSQLDIAVETEDYEKASALQKEINQKESLQDNDEIDFEKIKVILYSGQTDDRDYNAFIIMLDDESVLFYGYTGD